MLEKKRNFCFPEGKTIYYFKFPFYSNINDSQWTEGGGEGEACSPCLLVSLPQTTLPMLGTCFWCLLSLVNDKPPSITAAVGYGIRLDSQTHGGRTGNRQKFKLIEISLLIWKQLRENINLVISEGRLNTTLLNETWLSLNPAEWNLTSSY